MGLHLLRLNASQLERSFDQSCRMHGFADRWDYYRNEARVPMPVHAAHDAWIIALHAFYRARDGEHGVLGLCGL